MGQNNDPTEHGDLQGQQGAPPKQSEKNSRSTRPSQRLGGNMQNGPGSRPDQKKKPQA